MKLEKLTLKNFKGIKELILDLAGGNVSVYGDNATGKTTIGDGVYWLLFDKDSQFKKQFDIKTIDPVGNIIHGLDHDVEGVFSLDDGSKITLKKSYKEIWTKKRGEAQKTFTGHTTDYEINGVPVKKKEYTERTEAIIPEKTFQLLTTPSFFPEKMPWTERREIVLEICGDISDQEIINSDIKLGRLNQILETHTIDEHKKIIATRKAAINKELEKIPVRIDEVSMSMPDIKGIDISKEKEAVNEIKAKISEKEKQISRVESGGEIAEQNKKLAEVDAEISNLKNRLNEDHQKTIDEFSKKLRDAETKHDEALKNVKTANEEIESCNRYIKDIENRLEALRNEWHEENNRDFIEPNNPENCPTCGQSIPESDREEIRNKALAEFNIGKAKRLEEINGRGIKIKAELAEKQTCLDGLIANLSIAVDAEKKALIDLNDIDKEKPNNNKDIESIPEYQKLSIERQKIFDTISSLKNGTSDTIKEINADISFLNLNLNQSQEKVDRFNIKEKSDKRIAELEAEQRSLSAEFENIENDLFVIESFIKKKVEMLEGKINSKFKLARFKMFKEQINGGVDECCDVLYNGVPYSTGLNTGARINVGLDIINTLSKHYGLSAPIFIDNAEAVTNIEAPEGAQLIKMIVSKDDKELRYVNE